MTNTDVLDTTQEETQVHVPKKEIGLLDPQHQLMKYFREYANGTYAHSKSVVSMVENVMAALDINSQDLRLAAMYHDIGKTLNPNFFTENQAQDEINIHDTLDPYISYLIISRHASDTVMLMLANNFPMNAIKIASQHHGTTQTKVFLQKARDIDHKIEQNIFRYKTERPTSIEALILMLCDNIEATVRSLFLSQQLKEDPDVLVHRLFTTLESDSQFDNVSLDKIGQLRIIKEALVKDVAGNYHKRVVYPEDTNEESK